MSFFEVEGTISAIGQSQFDNDMSIYAFIEVTETTGDRTLIEKVAVFNDVGAVLALGVTGKFYVDRLYRANGRIRCQLWGVRSDRVAVLDRANLRHRAALVKFLMGIPAILVVGLGLILIADAIYLMCNDGDRSQFFGVGRFPPPLPTSVQTSHI